MNIYANIKGNWKKINDDYVINGESPENAVEKLSSENSDFAKHTNGYIQIASIKNNKKYYIHSSQIMWAESENDGNIEFGYNKVV